MPNIPQIAHERDAHQFVADTGDGEAVLAYRRAGGELTLVHTEVPVSVEGQGIGGALVRASLDYARAEGLRVRAQCPFAQAWVAEHDEYADVLA